MTSPGDGSPVPNVDPDGDGPARKAADAAVRRELVECHRDFLSFLRRRLANPQDAEDVLQEFIARALERSKHLRDVQSVRGWLSRILATTLVDHYRRAARRKDSPRDPADLEALAVAPDPEIETAVCFCLYRLLPTMKPAHSDLIWRIDLLGEPRDRVAATLGVTLNTVNVRLHRGRRTLRARLEELCLTCPQHGFLDCRCEEGERIRQIRARRAPAD
ncbi:MAG: RNA polymerase sigma factor [Phenylobacterium sp.]|uniref:RNA polymerase sigma factor n=1 Tax=Phenylobacterium sp. TaxID=1871053 RepID=UPI001222A07E|nr:RNA polymerase sigma factor [Phenylobacterium sp.]TAJ71767.1 MAG: RNA polymerase sigma factor [Phenylobacterium sp.]